MNTKVNVFNFIRHTVNEVGSSFVASGAVFVGEERGEETVSGRHQRLCRRGKQPLCVRGEPKM